MIGPAITAALPFIQSQAESLMTDEVTFTRAAGTPTFDPSTGSYTTPTPMVVYSGKCRISGHKTRFDRVYEAGAEPVSTMRIYVDLPVAADYDAAVDDIGTVTASLDPRAVGQKLRVRQPQYGSQMSARHLGCEWTELNAG